MTVTLHPTEEAASKTHNPVGWELRTIELKPSGKAPKRYPDNVYRFGAELTLNVIMPRRGWTAVKKTKNYIYLMPPAEQSKPPFYITISVPSQEECLNIARRCYAIGESWMGQLGEWPVWYLHERPRSTRYYKRNPITREMEESIIQETPHTSFSIGEYGIWRFDVRREDGDFRPPISVPMRTPSAPTIPQTSLYEGDVKTVELSKYERNPKARRLCIDHYGPKCQACGLDYEQKYGAMGAGLIHVHHIKPISEIGESYEVDPVRDLVPLCSTCHHVIHSRIPCYSVGEVIGALKSVQRQA